MDLTDISPESYIDVLAVLNKAPTSLQPISHTEIHLFSYLGCVISLFKGNPINSWGYKFSISSNGYPFSHNINEAIRNLFSRNYLIMDENGYYLKTKALINEFHLMSQIKESWPERISCINTSLECALALPIGSIKSAIEQSPGIDLKYKLNQRGELLEEDDIGNLYNEYSVIREALGYDSIELLSPAVIWLSARIMKGV
ncbi:hypothetical protein [Aeromonas veronii]|uniref:hypothetical protein n=1 Tax=Aeromonas veronii TaxID=654 RepID=UPI00244111CC|nr:hypothetical protein [Aeromonas veronii]